MERLPLPMPNAVSLPALTWCRGNGVGEHHGDMAGDQVGDPWGLLCRHADDVDARHGFEHFPIGPTSRAVGEISLRLGFASWMNP